MSGHENANTSTLKIETRDGDGRLRAQIKHTVWADSEEGAAKHSYLWAVHVAEAYQKIVDDPAVQAKVLAAAHS